MIHWCASCRVHMVRTPNTECPVCDTRPPAPVVVPRLQLDPLPAVGSHPSHPDLLMSRMLGVCWHSPTSDRWPCTAVAVVEQAEGAR